MIKGTYGTKLTPKQKAQEIIADLVARAGYWQEWDEQESGMTQRELEEVERHLDQQIARLKKMGFTYKD